MRRLSHFYVNRIETFSLKNMWYGVCKKQSVHFFLIPQSLLHKYPRTSVWVLHQCNIFCHTKKYIFKSLYEYHINNLKYAELYKILISISTVKFIKVLKKFGKGIGWFSSSEVEEWSCFVKRKCLILKIFVLRGGRNL